MKIGIIGCGTIGSYVLQKILQKPELGLNVELICGRNNASKGREFAEASGIRWTTTPSDFLNSGIDVVVEAASHEALATTGVICLQNGIDLVPVSVGTLVDSDLLNSLKNAAEIGKATFHIPSGGIGGMDALQAACIAGVNKVTMTTRKIPVAWHGIPYVERLNINLDALKEPFVLYEGPARECVKEFPQNINIAAVLSLSGIGFDKTKIRIVADPGVTLNTHDIEWEGVSGKVHIKLENVHYPENPKTTYLAALSVLAALQRIRASYRVGS